MSITIVAKFKESNSLDIAIAYEGEFGTSLPSNMSVAGRYLSVKTQYLLDKCKKEGYSPEVRITFPGQSQAGVCVEWQGLDKPEEQLPLLGHFLLSRADLIWAMTAQRQQQGPTIIRPQDMGGRFGMS